MNSTSSVLRRALLYIPGSSRKMLNKSRSLNVDLAVYDLEDSVSPHLKHEARSAVTDFLRQPRATNLREQAVRINAVDSGYALQDLIEVLKAPFVDTIVVPKVNSAADLHFVSDVIRHALPDQDRPLSPGSKSPVKILALIESAQALMSLREICTASPYLDGLVFAAEDFAADLSITRTPSLSEFLYARSAIVTATRAYNLSSAIDLVCTEFKGSEAQLSLEKESNDGKGLGFNGKQCIHPSQVEVVQGVYGPNLKELEWAVRVIVGNKRAETTGRGAWTLDGKMIDVPVVKKCMGIVAKADLCGYDMEKLFDIWKVRTIAAGLRSECTSTPSPQFSKAPTVTMKAKVKSGLSALSLQACCRSNPPITFHQPLKLFVGCVRASTCRPHSEKISHPNFKHRRHISSTTLNKKAHDQPETIETEPPRPLSGITVVSIEQAIAAPFCTRQLADLGARVIKVERPVVGDFARDYDTRVNGLASHFVWTNRSKESLALDLKKSEDLQVLKLLLRRADVLVQNLAPGASARLGLSYETLREHNPSLIVCDISGYGSDGPYKNKKAYDLLVQSEAGMLSVTGTQSGPAKAGNSIADIAAGMYAYSNILAAIIQRAKTGQGCKIDVSMLECMVEWMGYPMYYTYNNAPGPVPSGAAHASIYPYGPFDTGEGKTVMLGIQNEREWAIFCREVLHNPNLATDARFSNNSLRVQHRDELKRIICDAFSTLSAEQVIEHLDTAGIANAKVNNMHDVWNHPQLRARGRWTEVKTPAGYVPALVPPGIAASGSEGEIGPRMDAVPTVGEHNKTILAELGM
ncbi:hypothetical protein VE02_09276 [Pseudogymnoascus sp. 03VT05]|nr:hypothetical protein VE02_09276 [Pseudogymnoascus sp. 03VT05]